jgi:GNAT superfamily N-acetyltransferase
MAAMSLSFMNASPNCDALFIGLSYAVCCIKSCEVISSNSGTFTAILRASSLVSNLAAERRPILIRAAEPHDDLAGAIQRKVSPKSFFYRFIRPKHYLTDKEVASLVNCDFVSQVGLIELVRHNLIMAIVAGARYWITSPDEAEIAFVVADAYQKQGIGTAMLNHLCSIARQARLKRLYALAIPDNEGAPRLLNKLGFPCDIRRDPAQRMMHITIHLTSAAPTEELANSR